MERSLLLSVVNERIHAYGYFLNMPKIFQEYNVRIACSTGVAVTRACSRASAAENPMLHVKGLLIIINRKADQFMRIIQTPNIRDTKTFT